MEQLIDKQKISEIVEKYHNTTQAYGVITAEFSLRDMCAPYRTESEYKGDYYLTSERKINNYYSTVVERESITMGLSYTVDYDTKLIITGKTPLRQYFNKRKYFVILTHDFLVVIKRRRKYNSIPIKKPKARYIPIKSLFSITQMKII